MCSSSAHLCCSTRQRIFIPHFYGLFLASWIWSKRKKKKCLGLKGEWFGEEDGEVDLELQSSQEPPSCPIPPAAPGADRGAGLGRRRDLLGTPGFPIKTRGFKAEMRECSRWLHERMGWVWGIDDLREEKPSSLKVLLGKGILGWFGSD